MSGKITEFHTFAEEVSDVFRVIVGAYKELAGAYVGETIKSEALGKYSDVGKKMYHEKCRELGKVEKEREQAEYDRDYYEKYSRELLCEINRE